MAKAASKAGSKKPEPQPEKPPRKRSVKKPVEVQEPTPPLPPPIERKPIAEQAREDVLQEVEAEETKPEPVSKPHQSHSILSYVPLPLLIIAGVTVVLFIWLVLRGCNSPVVKNEKANAAYETEMARLKQERDSLQEKAVEDSITVANAFKYAEAAHAENERMEAALKEAETESQKILQQQKKSSDENKSVIKNGDARALDSLWLRLQVSKNFKQ